MAVYHSLYTDFIGPDGTPFVTIFIPKVCQQCEEGDYYKVYIGRNRYRIEGMGNLECHDDPDCLDIGTKGRFFQRCLGEDIQCYLWSP